MQSPPIALTPDIQAQLEAGAAVCCGVSGGKDSLALVIAVDRHLKEIGHTGPKLLMHADLGRVEWKDSLPSCERLARQIGWDLVVEARPSGDMLSRWESRWEGNKRRYSNLETVKVILPWSTPGMRFCTSELKVAVICASLKRRFPDMPIINATGIRRQESAARAKMSVSQVNSRLTRRGISGYNWNPIIEWPVEAVYEAISSAGLRLHEAYTVYGSSRVSCCYCILSSKDDMRAASRCDDNAPVYRQMVELEARSSFSFQSNGWLADVAPSLLDEDLRSRIATAKLIAEERQRVESRIPEHLLFVSGAPTVIPTPSEAALIGDVRRRVGELLGINVDFVEPAVIQDRYRELMRVQGAIRLQDLTTQQVSQFELVLA